ncbi:GNAT family N-acetyltransferase [Kutzneria sp. NPDC051319]|uniref:GNAT family N-acetyltransferase n=1 Tax=Kutzneria sp. NPDC051319 TaxID=3155047 RepID=UPI0034358AE6
MGITLGRPGVDELGEAVGALREWQREGAPMQLHPGDLGWHWRFGPQAMSTSVVTWSRNDQILAVGLLDTATILRLTIAPEARQDEELARQLVVDVSDPQRGVLPEGPVNIESPADALFRQLLADKGWGTDEPWTPLLRDLTEPVPDPGVRIEVVGPEQARVRAAVHAASFGRATLTADSWPVMAAGLPYADARCLVSYDGQDNAVAAVTVWSAGPGKPGLLEPLGTHRDHRGHGHGRAMSIAAAAALRELGSSSALVCTPSANVAAVATYASAGYRPLPEVCDRRRDA